MHNIEKNFITWYVLAVGSAGGEILRMSQGQCQLVTSPLKVRLRPFQTLAG